MKAPLLSLASALLLAGSLAACSSKIPAEVGAIADRACACKTVECADKAEKEYQDYAKAHPQVKGTKEERDETQGHYNRMRECIGRTRGMAAPAAAGGEASPTAPAPTTPPPAETPTAPAGQAPAAPAPAPAAPAETR